MYTTAVIHFHFCIVIIPQFIYFPVDELVRFFQLYAFVNYGATNVLILKSIRREKMGAR